MIEKKNYSNIEKNIEISYKILLDTLFPSGSP